MKIGFLGLGKLGLPCALVANSKGHNVFGYDIDLNVKNILETKEIPYREEGTPELLKNHSIKWSSVSEVVSNSEIIFELLPTHNNIKSYT